MRLQELLATLNEGVNIDVFDKNTDKHLGRYDGKNSLAEVLNYVKIIKIDLVLTNEIDITVDFSTTRYFSSFNIDVLYNEYYEWYKDVIGIEIQTVESDFGTLYIDGNGNARTYYNFMQDVVYKDQTFSEYVLDNLEKFEEIRNS